ncbi:alpha/beta hydrolase fold domain-containing protein [Streptomyces cellulosae]|uniref:alpha/beta hydrolase fold domain-containing protein n=1 Tax=Streptomyces cellulosae TaxID=1968 RepID=UPI0004C9A019|nr:alpha/beta hydrolase fold domain-containing protein [Streptomyces cellulosae]
MSGPQCRRTGRGRLGPPGDLRDRRTRPTDLDLEGPARHHREGDEAYAAPARTEDLTGLPPACVCVCVCVCVCELDPLRDEAIAYAQRLLRAGVPTELHLIPGTFHGSHAILGPKINELVNAEAVTVIQRALKIEQ